ncbi:type 1 fimbrial protein [Frateuria edaphi]|uniref:fimbrial protein n=1 Tax=Frateuria edaphi TaxID=2898793 RepID=UPI001E585A85|nr:fimbrial protein [Frateuria edaphi]UGB45830.1 type 1 fimbrial protein [Frateuria edaphi]
MPETVETDMHHSPIATVRAQAHRAWISPSRPVWAGLCLLAFLSGLLVWPATVEAAQAQCYFRDGSGNNSNAIDAPPVQIVTFDSITIPLSNPPAPGGSAIGPPRAATASSGTIYIACQNGGTDGGLQPSYGTYNPANNTIYSPTPGVAFQILRSGNAIPLYPGDSLSGGLTTSFTNTTTFQLISTGVLPSNGSNIPAGTVLGEWQFDNICTKPRVKSNGDYNGCDTNAAVKTVIIFQSGGVTFTASTCNVSTGSKNVTVTLPSVAANAFGAVGATAGTTRFAINLTGCSTNLDVSATLSTSSPNAASGVIDATTGAGYASGVGVQILRPDGATPVTFDTAFPTGTTNGANSNYTINLYARYYQTAATITPGQVQAAATYTLTYQ